VAKPKSFRDILAIHGYLDGGLHPIEYSQVQQLL
jgi:hypothetical protein